MKHLISLTILFIGCSISYIIGKTQDTEQHKKDYQVACILSDCCRNMVDNIGLEADEIYSEYIDNLDCDSNLIITREDISNYYWCY